MESVRFQVDPSSGAQDRVMEEHYRRLHYEAAQPQYWTQPPHKAVALTRLKRHLPAIPKKKGKESSKKGEHFDVPAHAKHYKDKYGSVSAHSTSAIYGALRAPHYHAIYGPSNMWYASVRSLNRGCPRDVIYPVEAYDWRDTVYEDVAKEVFTTPPVGTHPAGGCVCVVRRRPPQDGPPLKPRQLPRCKYCANGYAVNGSSNNVPASSKRLPPNSEKTKTSSVTEESIENKPEPSSRMSGYKKCISGHSKYGKSSLFNKGATKESILTRKSILECDVTAYDLIKKVAKTPSVSEIDDSDIDDNLSDNAVAKMNKAIQLHSKSPLAMSGTARQLANKKQAASFKKSQSENCIYNETGSVLVGGQRIFTDRHRSKSPDIDIICDTSNNSNEIENHFTRWRSASDESICIPDPDYDYSDDSDEETVIGLKYRNPKFTYSPPPIRKSSESAHNGLDYSSRELSKSMSSLLSDDTYVPSINVNYSNHSTRRSDSVSSLQDCDNYHLDENESEYVERSDTDDTRVADPIPSTSNLDPPENENLKRELKYESSSDCSSSGGTLSSEYPTWTSSSSNELKSILKKKRRRDNAIQEQEDANRVFHNSEEAKENQKKKQVQFLAGEQTKFFDSISVQDGDSRSETGDPEDSSPGSNGEHSSDEDIPSVINCDTYETLSEALSDKSWMESENNPRTEKYCQNAEKYAEKEQALIDGEQSVQHTNGEQRNYHKSKTFKKFSNEVDLNDLHTLPKFKDHDIPPALPSSLPPKRPPGLSSSLDDVSGRTVEKSNLTNGKEKSYRRRWRTTLPKCRFSDLHILLCPSKSFCVDGSSSDDVPLTASPRKPQSRSLPDSPTELDEVPSFSFDFRDRNTKEKILAASRSVFYVPVDGQTKVPESNQNNTPVSDVLKNEKFSSQVSPSIEENHNNPSTGLRRKDTSDVEDVISADHYDTDEDILENDYENLDPIYEELHDVSNSSKRLTSLESNQKSFFEGASKIDILSYLEDAKERGISEGLSEDEKVIIEEEEDEDEKVLSGEEEDTGEKQRVIAKNDLNHKEVLLTIEKEVKIESVKIDETVEDDSKTRISEVERNDSGVGTETSKPCRLKQLPSDWEEQLCADCDHQVEPIEDENSGLLFSPLVCRKCEFRRCERKEIIIEFVDTELKYGRDLKIIKDEFYRPMEIAGLLAKDQLFSIFLNLEELINANSKFSEKLQDALDIAMEHGDEDYTTVNLGKIFLESSSMLHAFETYCVKQAPASVLLSSLEKEKELLRIFLRVSQMENTLLRRMNLPAFLMVPVQRVTRYPLLLSRLHKVTPIHHKDRGALKEAQQKVELHLEHINQQTKGVGGTKIWRRISNISASHRRLGKDIGSIKLRKMALEVLNWKQDETRFVMAGKLLFTQITDYPWNKKGKTIKFTCVHALLIALGKPNSNYRPDSSQLDNSVLFPRNTGIRDASLVLMKEKNGRFVVVRDPLYLGNCVISCESDTDDVFEIQEYTTKDAYLMKGETKKETKEWLRMLRYHAKDLGPWRKRRNALANIMINGMIRQ